MDITNVINTIEKNEVSNSYRWDSEKTKNTFPATLWVPILMGLIYYGETTSNLEKEYVKYLPKVRKATHGMYVNSLLKKVLVSNNQDYKNIKKSFSQEDIENWIVKRIQSIYLREYNNAVSKARKWLDEWERYYKHTYGYDANSTPTPKEKEKFYETFSEQKIDWTTHKIEQKENLKKVTLKTSNFSANSESEKKAIGDIGEKLFYTQLVNKHGFQKVNWASRDIDPFSPFDFKVNINGVNHYYEVKSTTRNSVIFFLSRNEYEFWKENKKCYHLITIKNIYLKKAASFPVINEIANPIFLIDLDYYGTKNGVIHITPYKFKGWT